ncbi:hypothetical protein [Desulfobacter postgatei]|uniref:hypothetical protein n=1 Tax=Desulfobacter postgatei TaxID=2293 RepID=UPI002FDA76C5
MISDAIQKLIDIARPPKILIGSKDYRLKEYEPVLKSVPPTLQINNLTGIQDFVNLMVEPWGDVFIHVRDYNKVFLFECMTGAFNQRPAIIEATSRPVRFQFGKAMDIETFIISLNADFVQTPDRDYLLKFVSGIKVDHNATMEDDGVSQTLKARLGASSLIKDIPIKNIVDLAPFRTFSEIEQPVSKFLFRLVLDADKQPRCVLFEADGEAWKQDAIREIKLFLKDTTNEQVIA